MVCFQAWRPTRGLSGTILLLAIFVSLTEAKAQASGEQGRVAAKDTDQTIEQQREQGVCQGFDFSGKVTDGYFVQHGGGKVKVRIPVAYLLFPEVGSSFITKNAGEANFNFHRDTLKPYPRQEMLGKIVAGKEEWISFLVTNLVEIDVVARNLMNFYSQRSLRSDLPAFPEKAATYNLMQVELPERQQPGWQKKTLYFARDAGKITDVISCNIPLPEFYPHCEQSTRVGKYDVKILYPLDQLKSWKTIRQNIQYFLDCMSK